MGVAQGEGAALHDGLGDVGVAGDEAQVGDFASEVLLGDVG